MDSKKVIEKLGEIGSETSDRRGFLKKAGKVAATVPAVALLLSANSTPAEAYNRYGRGGKGGHGHEHGHAKHHGRSSFGLSHKKH